MFHKEKRQNGEAKSKSMKTSDGIIDVKFLVSLLKIMPRVNISIQHAYFTENFKTETGKSDDIREAAWGKVGKGAISL